MIGKRLSAAKSTKAEVPAESAGPKHVAIIMDGNGRWGLKKYNSRRKGHIKGIKTVEEIIDATIKKKIKFLTLYTFSTENWKRPGNEIIYLLKLYYLPYLFYQTI